MPGVPAPSPVVLVVEDEWLVSSAVVENLTNKGCLVLEASSGEGALAYLDGDQAVDVLFTDLRLGGSVTGWDVAEAFRERDANVGVIYTSGHSIDRRRDVSGSLFFGKPYNPTSVSESCLKMAENRVHKRSAEKR